MLLHHFRRRHGMNTLMKTRIIKIGNAYGIRIPKLVMEQVGLTEEVEVEVQDNQIIIRPAHPPRYGWDAQFQAMAAQGDDRLLDEPLPATRWETEEWEW
jgi:antitoxin MazE